jgi:hypothetical protein
MNPEDSDMGESLFSLFLYMTGLLLYLRVILNVLNQESEYHHAFMRLNSFFSGSDDKRVKKIKWVFLYIPCGAAVWFITITMLQVI